MEISHQRKRVRNAVEQSAKHYGSRTTVNEQADRHDQANDSVHYPTSSQDWEVTAWVLRNEIVRSHNYPPVGWPGLIRKSTSVHQQLFIARNKRAVCSHLNTWLQI